MSSNAQFDMLSAAIDDLFILPNNSSNVTALRDFVRHLQLGGVSIQDYGKQVLLQWFNQSVSGGADAGTQSLDRNAWALYLSLPEPRREALKSHYLDHLRKAQEDPAAKEILAAAC